MKAVKALVQITAPNAAPGDPTGTLVAVGNTTGLTIIKNALAFVDVFDQNGNPGSLTDNAFFFIRTLLVPDNFQFGGHEAVYISNEYLSLTQ